MPSVREQFAAPVGGGPQVPRPRPASLVTLQTPLQQSVPVAHTSPPWPQNEDALQWPPRQSPEQQSASAAQALPSVAQVGLSGTHLPPEQRPLQHAALPVHARLSEVHGGRLQTPPEQAPEQHSPWLPHAAPRGEQLVPLPVVRPLPVVVPPPVVAVPLAAAPPLPLPPVAPFPPAPPVPPKPAGELPQPPASEAAARLERAQRTNRRSAADGTGRRMACSVGAGAHSRRLANRRGGPGAGPAWYPRTRPRTYDR